jgi:hypothetical protein
LGREGGFGASGFQLKRRFVTDQRAGDVADAGCAEVSWDAVVISVLGIASGGEAYRKSRKNGRG